MTVGIVGVGGLGTMGIKLAKALGHKVVAVSTSAHKADLAKQKGADVFVVSSDNSSIQANAGTVDLLLNTVSANHDINTYLPLLAKNGTIVQLGVITQPHPVNQLPLMFNRQSISGSLIGGIQATQECLQFCADHQIYPDTQIINANQLEQVWDQLQTTNKDGIRYVIDIKKSLADSSFLPIKKSLADSSFLPKNE